MPKFDSFVIVLIHIITIKRFGLGYLYNGISSTDELFNAEI